MDNVNNLEKEELIQILSQERTDNLKLQEANSILEIARDLLNQVKEAKKSADRSRLEVLPKAKVTTNRAITIPKEICEKLGLQPNKYKEYVYFDIVDDEVRLITSKKNRQKLDI